MQDKKAKYDFSKWDRDLVSSITKNRAFLESLISNGLDTGQVRRHLTGMLRSPITKGDGEPSQWEQQVNKARAYSRRYLRSLLNIKPSLIHDDERDVLESILHRLDDMSSLIKQCEKTQYENMLKLTGIDPRLKTKNQREGMIIYNLHAILNPIALRMSYTQQDTFSLIAELLNITNPEIEPTNIYDTDQVKDLYFNILKFT